VQTEILCLTAGKNYKRTKALATQENFRMGTGENV
jgi:hypothetical protein